ncbi:hypothetical protein [Winogradskyella sp.]|uniref:hypothetical protein n=1 Tax=Winogradskyella sp. TaxID=1883156 RepID=UPI002626C156|nr:hypothetical protein [Winogradskyella sp.]
MKIIEFFYDNENYTLSIVLNIFGILLVVILFFLIRKILKWIKNKSTIGYDIKLAKLKYKILGAEYEYQIQANYQNIEIAHKIYIELITRKAAILFDEKEDVISQIYDSWYKLFDITRQELKSYTGESILNKSSDQITSLLTDILNKGLRPHLTKYQAEYRKWYQNEVDNHENNKKSPQEVQKQYPKYKELVNSLKEVNKSLIDYSNQLKNIWLSAR